MTTISDTTDRPELDLIDAQNRFDQHERERQADRLDRRLRDRARARRRRITRAVVGGTLVAVIAAGAIALITDQASASGTSQAKMATLQPAKSGSASSGTQVAYQHGAWVVTLQQDLAQLNSYNGPIDGIYGPETTAAVEAFQAAHGLTVDGIAGPQTMAAIQQALANGDNQMGPSGPATTPAANLTPAKPETGKMANLAPAMANVTPETPPGSAAS